MGLDAYMDGRLEGSKEKWVSKELWKLQADNIFILAAGFPMVGVGWGAFHGENHQMVMVNDFLKKTSYGMPGLKKVKFHAPVQHRGSGTPRALSGFQA